MGHKTMFRYFDKAEYISKGTNSDPQLKFNGKLYNYYHIEDAMFDMYLDDRGLTHFDEYDDNDFEKWCMDNQSSIEDLFNRTDLLELLNDNKYRSKVEHEYYASCILWSWGAFEDEYKLGDITEEILQKYAYQLERVDMDCDVELSIGRLADALVILGLNVYNDEVVDKAWEMAQ